MLVVVMLLLATCLWAQSGTIPVQGEMVTVPKSALTPQQLQQVQLNELDKRIQTYGKWVGMGKEIGEAANGALGAVTTNAEQLSQTGVGKFLLFIVAWKVLGKDIIQFLVGVPMLIFGLSVFVWSWRRNCIFPRVVKVTKGEGKKIVEYDQSEDWDEQQANYLRWAHIGMLFLWVLMCMIIIFA